MAFALSRRRRWRHGHVRQSPLASALACAAAAAAVLQGAYASASAPAAGAGAVDDMVEDASALRRKIMEVNGIAAELHEAGELDTPACDMIEGALATLEARVSRLSKAEAHPLQFMVSVVRGTLRQEGRGLSDGEVEREGEAFTFSSPRLWENYYESAPADGSFDWYASWDAPIATSGVAFAAGGSASLATDGAASRYDASSGAETLGDVVRAHLSKDSKILVLGCGNSDMSEKLYRHGFEDITNVDISEPLLSALRKRLQESMPRMRWERMSAEALQLPTGSFDVVLEKSTLDALERNETLFSGAVREAFRILKPGGVLVSITGNAAPSTFVARLQSLAGWVECQSRAVDVISADWVKMRCYVHACRRPLGGGLLSTVLSWLGLGSAPASSEL